ncbi:radical SAM protein [Synechococcus sp. CBW1002]|uniref:coproporphyrinogen-III oxidase family protein n=1 Tax=unclassified Synechococcus TaxID=2626047 RepID=UPI0018CE89A1|nr:MULTISPECIES: coproporphyrinogen-III oxidase family protein [unclassified Synechococcus]QPN58559.1 radical SAM protein [Synechococcus sp. CBW1002]QPN65298.1 radical SAM protein [Synechococcus sp. CBW1006]
MTAPWPWPPRSAYLHIPFCHRRCFYCDFPVVPLGDRADGSRSPSIPAYLALLEAEIAASPPGPSLSTVYLGGGTPSLLTPEQVEGLLASLQRRYGLAAGAELSLELDPASFDQTRLEGYLSAGINRVSLGGQSFDDTVLAGLGRRHRRSDLLEACGWLAAAQRRGSLRSWSLDLIQGLPLMLAAPEASETAAGAAEAVQRHWRAQLEAAVAQAPPHLSIYDLIVEPGTVFARRLEQGNLDLPDGDLGADLMELTWERLQAAGYGHYEISNYARPGHASRHNRVYWSGGGWWGFGMGATSAPDGARLARPRTREAYATWLAAAADPNNADAAGASQSMGMPLDERLLVGLRRREGVNLAALARSHGLAAADLIALQERLQSFLEGGQLLIEGPRWRLSDPKGLALSNAVLRELLDWYQGWEERQAKRSAPRPSPEELPH